VYWIGGGSGAGKHGLRLYSTDDAMADHGAAMPP
jgi:hypothetical protein